MHISIKFDAYYEDYTVGLCNHDGSACYAINGRVVFGVGTVIRAREIAAEMIAELTSVGVTENVEVRETST